MGREDSRISSADLEAVRGGNPAAIDRWFRLEHPRVWRLCLGFLGSVAEADVSQDAMLKLHDQLGRWDATRPYGPWRNSLVLNLCRDRLRRGGARARAEERAAEWRSPVMATPAENLEQQELRELLQQALGALTGREREAFVLRELEGVATSEVARSMAVSEGTVRSLLSLARRRLRSLLGKQLSEHAGGEDV